MADYIYLVQMDIPEEYESEFNRIYDEQHIPNILTVPGVEACSRYKLESADVDGIAKYAAIYEVESPDLPESDAWVEQSDKGDWAPQIRPHATNRSRAVFKKIT